MDLQIRLLNEFAVVPTRAHEFDAGLDLSYAGKDTVLSRSGERMLLGTGIAIAIPNGYVGLVHPRSGLAHKKGITTLNGPGTIDAGYRGEVFVNLYNSSYESVWIEPGDRIAQLVIQRVELPEVIVVESLDETVRGSNGHGSSGT